MCRNREIGVVEESLWCSSSLWRFLLRVNTIRQRGNKAIPKVLLALGTSRDIRSCRRSDHQEDAMVTFLEPRLHENELQMLSSAHFPARTSTSGVLPDAPSPYQRNLERDAGEREIDIPAFASRSDRAMVLK
jgi:hypothetical protein